MKKVLLITVYLLTLLLLFSGCKAKEPIKMKFTDSEITFKNEINDADVWIIPQTEKNLKTTVWGTPLASKVKAGESRNVPLCKPGDDELYLFRMIDTDEFYYSADGISLGPDYTVLLTGEDFYSLSLEVRNKDGVLLNTYKVSAARL